MRKGLLSSVASIALAMSVGVACSTNVERSGFSTEPDPTEADGTDFGNKDEKDPNAAEGCSNSKTEISRVPVVIEFVVDESGSMDSSNYWTSARDALLAAFEEMEKTPDPAMFIGLMRYSSAVGDTVAPGSLATKGQYDDLVQTIDTPKAGGGGTATDLALKAAYTVVEKFKPKSMTGLVPDQMNRVVVLLSDGVPNSKPACESIVEEKFNASPPKGPILTFAVGIGQFGAGEYTYDPQFMGRLAQKGGTAPQDCALDATDPTATCHFQITPGQDPSDTKQALLDAFNKIRALSTSCEFSFERNDNTDLENVKVKIVDSNGDEQEVPQDPDDGWTFDDEKDPTKVVLHGSWCAQSAGAVAGRVDITIGCSRAN